MAAWFSVSLAMSLVFTCAIPAPDEMQQHSPGCLSVPNPGVIGPSQVKQKVEHMDDSKRTSPARTAPAPSTPCLSDRELLGAWIPGITLDDYWVNTSTPKYNTRSVRSAKIARQGRLPSPRRGTVPLD